VCLALLASVFAVWPVLRRDRYAGAREEAEARDAQNLGAYKAEREELDAARTAGVLPEDEYRALIVEMDRRLLQDADADDAAALATRSGGRRLLLAVAVMLPLFGVVAYSFLGAAGAERLDALLGQLENAQDEEQRAAVMAEVLPLLEAEARRRDPDGAYRFLLARVYSGEQRFPESAATYAEVAELYPEDATILAQYAQALYLAGGRKITPAVQEVIDRALAIDPAQVTLLGLLGMDRFQSGNFAGAVEAWEKLLANLPPDAPDASVIRDGVSAARERLAASGQVVPEPAAGEGKAASAEGPRLEVRVELSPELQAGPDTTVFVFAKALSGPPMPLAVARFPVSELPKTIVLDDTMAMAPGLRLSGFPEVNVVARVSRGGGPIAQPGDFEGDAGPVATGKGPQQVSVRIYRKL
jgi:cytochrome c-type biogenesis protein CcmH